MTRNPPLETQNSASYMRAKAVDHGLSPGRVGAPLEALMSLTALLTSNQQVETVIQQALDTALGISRHDQGSIILVVGRRLVIRAVVGLDPALAGTAVKDRQRSVAGWVLHNRRPLYLEGRALPPKDLRVEYTKDLASSICLPLLTPPSALTLALSHAGRGKKEAPALALSHEGRGEGKAIGVLSLNAVHHAARLSEDEVQVLQAVANHVAIAIDNAQLYESLRQKEQQLQQAAAGLVHAQEAERKRVAYDIHDGLAQLLVGAFQRLQTYQEHRSLQSTGAQADLQQLEAQLKDCIQEVRHVIADLRPTILDDFGLETAFRRYLEGLAHDAGWEVDFRVELQGQPLPAAVETAAFRILQEAASNARRHAHSTRLAVSLRRRNDRLSLQVRDWGCGLPAEPSAEGLGLRSMEERATALGGTLSIKSSRGRGTRVDAWLPLPSEAGIPR